jgi:hypothetical protein
MNEEDSKVMNIRTHTNLFNTVYKNIKHYSFEDKVEQTFIGNETMCRFCGEVDKKFFKKKNAHTFPSSAGNKNWLYSKDECTTCNTKFGMYEDELANFNQIYRSVYGIGKKSPKYKQNGNIIHEKNQKLNIQFNPETTHIEMDEEYVKIKLKLIKQKYNPLYLFKSLCKIAYSILPIEKNDSENFTLFKEWLTNIDNTISTEGYEPYFHIFNKFLPFNSKPFLALYRRRDDLHNGINIPSFTFIFVYSHYIFQIFLPYYKPDVDKILLNEINLPLILQSFNPENKKINAIKGWVNKKVEQEPFNFNITYSNKFDDFI